MLRRRYNQWSGNPLGTREDPHRCAVEVPGRGLWGPAESHQCTRTRGHGPDGLYCTQHAKQLDTANPPRVPERTPTPTTTR